MKKTFFQNVLAFLNCVKGLSAKSDPAYKIGDTGPGGGIVFFDRGSARDGWQYLEAAPVGAEFTAQWGAYKKDIPETMTGIGFGKQNTKIIVEHLSTLGETNKAAQICAALEINGYKDWFLPSKDELDLMYKNLAQKGLGDFKTVQDIKNYTHIYWSSSHCNNYDSWSQGFNNGKQDEGYYNDHIFSVRVVRTF